MASKGLGYYIHYHIGNYRNWGINERINTKGNGYKNHQNYSGGGEPKGFTASYRNSKNELFKSINQSRKTTDIKKLEDEFNSLIYNQNNDRNQIISDQEYNDIITSFETAFKARWKNYDAMYRGLDPNVQTSQLRQLFKNNSALLKKINLNNTVGFTGKTLWELQKSIKQSLKFIENCMKQQQAPITELQIIQKNLETSKKIINQMIRAKTPGKNYITKKDYNKRYGFTKDKDNLLSAYKEAVNLLKGVPSIMAGELGEVGAILTMLIISKSSKQEIDKFIANMFNHPYNTGKELANVKITFSDYISQDLIKNEVFKTTYTLSGNTYTMTGGGTQQTVDIQLPIDTNDYGYSELQASVKNYGSLGQTKKGVSVLSGAPLTTILMLFDSDFSNHYLNLMASRKMGSEMLASYKQLASSLVRLGAATRGIMGLRDKGNVSGNKISEVFILNDRAKQRVRIISSKELLQKIGLNNQSEYLNISGLPNNIKMTWEPPGGADKESAKTRINRYLTEVHKQKLYVSLKPAIFK